MSNTQTVNLGHVKIEIVADNSSTKYTFIGDIDEQFAHARIPKHSDTNVTFNLGQIKNLNSSGVREWMFFVKEFSSTKNFFMEECPVAFIDQFNIIPQTFGKAQIKSFYAPYYCNSCDKEVSYLIETEKHKDVLLRKQAPVVQCSCEKKTTLEFDALEDCYFLFMANGN